MKGLLLLTPEPVQGASSRLRVIDLMPFWEGHYQMAHMSFLSEKSYAIKDRQGYFVQKVCYLLLDTLAFIFKFVPALLRTDIVLIHRNLSPLGPPVLEALAVLVGKTVVYDFDDAIYLNPQTARNQWLGPLKMNAFRTSWLVRHAAVVLAGNEHLANYSASRNAKVEIVPTGLDLSAYAIPNRMPITDRKVIGWIGSPGTETFVREILPVLIQLVQEHADWQVHLIGADFDTGHKNIKCLTWSQESELAQMRQFSIGINPLADNEFTRGKCGFKVVQYQALGIPSVSSPVGICREQVVENETGFLATSLDDWQRSLTSLISNPELLIKMGNAALPLAQRSDRQLIAQQVKAVLDRV